MSLARLEKVNLRHVWKHEAYDFTNWLAEPENLEQLGEEIGVSLDLIQTEASVGRFNVDILAEESDTGRKVVIENQLESTDHDHLGKIITYASGLGAEIVIWIVKNVRDEHKRAVDWLNEHTDTKVNFFAIEMELWKIGESLCAPKFHVIAEPNDWAKVIKQTGGKADLSDSRVLQVEYWESFGDYVESQGSPISLRKPRPQAWYNVSIGSSKFHVSNAAYTRSNEVKCRLWITNSKGTFNHFFAHRDEVEAHIGKKLEWINEESNKSCQIGLSLEADVQDKRDWPRSHAWLLEMTLKFQEIFMRLDKSAP